MNAGKQAGWLCMVLIALAFSGWYFASSTPAIKLNSEVLSTTSDMVVYNLTVRQYDTTGLLVNYLQTPLLRHIPRDNTHFIKTPHIVVKEAAQPPWEIRAQQAISTNGGERIQLNNKVIIHQNKDEHTAESTFKTKAITYFPKTKFATTPEDITYEQLGSMVQARGMNAYLAEKRVQLLSQARGTYVPNHG